MMVLYLPQINDEEVSLLRYEFSGDVLTVKYKDEIDVYDFTGLPEGEAEGIDSDISISPVREVRKENGELWVTLLKFIREDAPEKDKFPDWVVGK